MALVPDGSADLADGVDELDTKHPFGGGELDLTGEIVDVLDESAQEHTSALGGLGSHGVNHIGSEVGVELAVGRHCVCMGGWMSRRQFRGSWRKVDWMDERANIARTSKVYIHDLRQVWIVRDADGKSFRLLILVGVGNRVGPKISR